MNELKRDGFFLIPCVNNCKVVDKLNNKFVASNRWVVCDTYSVVDDVTNLNERENKFNSLKEAELENRKKIEECCLAAQVVKKMHK